METLPDEIFAGIRILLAYCVCSCVGAADVIAYDGAHEPVFDA